VLGVVGLGICQVAWLYSLTRIPASAAVILSNTTPLFVALVAALWLGEPLGQRGLLGLLVSFVGVVLVVGGGEMAGASAVLGVVAAMLSAATWAGYIVGCRALTARYEPLRITAIGGLMAALCWLPLGLLEQPNRGIASLEVFLGVVYLGVVPGACAYMLFSQALGRLRAVQVGAFPYLVPIWAVLLAAGWLGEALTLPLVVGMLLVFVGLRLAQQR
jgi:drug/metabolite transporter (DMT)-like permease